MDILTDCLIDCDLCQICLLVVLCYKHMKFNALSKLLFNDRLQFFLCVRIIRIKPAKRCLEFHIQYRFTSLSIVFRHRLKQRLFESCCSLSNDHLPACHYLLQVFRSSLLWRLRRFCLCNCCFASRCCRTLYDYLLYRAFLYLLLQYTDTIQNRIQVRLHCRTAEFDQSNFHKHSFLCCKTNLIGQI